MSSAMMMEETAIIAEVLFEKSEIH